MEAQRFNLSLKPDDVSRAVPTVYARQYESGREYIATIYDVDGNLYTFTDEVIRLTGTKPSGKVFYADATASGNTITFVNDNNMTVAYGDARCDFEITKGSAVIGSLAFTMHIQKAGAQVEGVVDDPNFGQIVTDALADMGALPTVSLSGSVVSFADGADNAPVQNLTIDIGRNQASGTPSPSNVIPINGWTGANIYVSPTQNEQDATVYAISFGAAGTVYGGTLDVMTGKLTVTWGIVDMGTLDWAKHSGTTTGGLTIYRYDGLDRANGRMVYSDIYDTPTSGSVSALTDCQCTGNATSARVYVVDTRYSTPAALKAGIAGHYLCYELAEPVEYTLTPIKVRTLLGTNNIWADTGNISVEYVADATAYIDGVGDIVTNSPNFLAPLMLGRDTPYAQFVITSSAATLTLPQDTFIMLRTGAYKHIAPANAGPLTIDLLDITPATTAVQVAYNIDTESVVLKRFNTPLSDSEYVFCVLRRNAENSSISITCPYMLNGKMYGIDYAEYESPYVKGVNHRGYTTAPENTLPAFRLSRQMGFSYVECDVTLTSDDVPVLLHDDTINRTARNADGTELSSTVNIADITYAQALTYDFGIYKSSAYAGTTIPTFEEFLALCRNLGLHPYIEIKESARYTEAKVQGLVDTVRRYGMSGGVTWISAVFEYLEYVRDYDANARLGYIVSTISAAALTATQSLKTASNYVSIDARITNLTDALVQSCIDANVPLEVWTVDDAATILSMSPYITGVTSNSLIAGKVLFNNSIIGG